MKVLVIPEDPTHDQYVLKPIVEHVFRDLDRKARVEVLQDPHLKGVSQALDRSVIAQILDQRRMFDLFLLMVDRDAVVNRQSQVDARVEEVAAVGRTMLGCLAIEEVEVWALALHRSELPDPWEEVRRHPHPKEAYFDPLAKRMNWLESKGKGRAGAMQALAGNWRNLKGRCPELQDAVAEWLATQ